MPYIERAGRACAHANGANTTGGGAKRARCGRFQDAASLENCQSVYPWLGQRALRAPLGTGRRVFAHRPGTATGAQVKPSAYLRRAHDRHGRMTPRVPQPLRIRVRLERMGLWGTLGSIFRCRPRNELRRRACTRG